MNEVIAAGLGALAAVVVALLGLFGANKVGIGKAQERLVSNLKDLVDVQTRKIEILEGLARDNLNEINKLRQQVSDLQTLTINQAKEISELRRNRPTRRRQVTTNEST